MLEAWLAAVASLQASEKNGLMWWLRALKIFSPAYTTADVHDAWFYALLSERDLFQPYDAAFYRHNNRVLISSEDRDKILQSSMTFPALARDVMTALDMGEGCLSCEKHCMEKLPQIQRIVRDALERGSVFDNSDSFALQIKRKFCNTWRSRLYALACMQKIALDFVNRFFFTTADLRLEHSDATPFYKSNDAYQFGHLHGKVKILCQQKSFQTDKAPLYKCKLIFDDTAGSHSIRLGSSDVNYLLRALDLINGSDLALERSMRRKNFFADPPASFTRSSVSMENGVELVFLEADLLLSWHNNFLHKLTMFNVSYDIALHNPFLTAQKSRLEQSMNTQWRNFLVIVDDAASAENSYTLSFERLQRKMKEIDNADKYGFVLGFTVLRYLIKVASNGNRLIEQFSINQSISLFALYNRVLLMRHNNAIMALPEVVDLKDPTVANYMERQLIDMMCGGAVNSLWLGYAHAHAKPYIPMQFARNIISDFSLDFEDRDLNIMLYLQNELQHFSLTEASIFSPTSSSQFQLEVIGSALVLAYFAVRRAFGSNHVDISHQDVHNVIYMHNPAYFDRMQATFDSLKGETPDQKTLQSLKSKLALAHALLQAYTQQKICEEAVTRLQIYMRKAVAKRQWQIYGRATSNYNQLILAQYHATTDNISRKRIVENMAVSKLQAAIRASKAGKNFFNSALQLYRTSGRDAADDLLRDSDPKLADLFWRISFPSGVRRKDGQGRSYYCQTTAENYFVAFCQEAIKNIGKKMAQSYNEEKVLAIAMIRSHRKGTPLPNLNQDIWQTILRQTGLWPLTPPIFDHTNEYCQLEVLPFMHGIFDKQCVGTSFAVIPNMPQHYFDSESPRNKINARSFAIPRVCSQRQPQQL